MVAPVHVKTNQELVALLQARMADYASPRRPFTMPPPCFLEMDAQVVDYDAEARTLRIRFPVQERWLNPAGVMQGGFLTAAVDNTFGPLSYLVAPPSVTTHMDTTFIRPVTPRDGHIIVTARVVAQTRQQIHLAAEVHNPKGKLVALATSSQVFL